MTQNHAPERVYLTLDVELQTRIDIAYAAAKRGKQRYPRSDFLQKLIRDALDQRDDVVGSKAALANRVGDRLATKIDTLLVIMLAIFHLIAARSNAPDQLKTSAFLWAVENSASMEQRVAELRNAVAKHTVTRDDDEV